MTSLDIQPPTRPESHLVTVFGGSGFVGQHVVRALAKRGYRIRVAVRRPELAFHLQPLGKVGQIVAVQANLRHPDSVRRAVQNADHVVNLVGILQEVGGQTFSGVQVEGAAAVARAAAEVGARLVHISAIGANENSDSAYARAKALGEQRAFEAVPDAVVLRPSLVFGPGDSFFNRFASLARALPVLPLVGGQSRFQPVFVGDVAEAVAQAVDARVEGGRIYELGGPEVATLEHLVRFMLEVTMRKRLVVDLPLPAARLQARALELADALTFGLLIPDTFKLTRDQVALLQSDNVVSDAAKAEGRTFEAFGILPTAAEAVAPGYLWTFRRAGQFATGHGTESMEAIPATLAPDPTVAHALRPQGPAIGPDTSRPSRMGRRWGERD